MAVHPHFDDAARTEIAEAVKAAEAGTTGEIVPVVLARSEAHTEGRYRGAVIGALVMTLLAPLVPTHLPVYAFVGLQLLGFVLGFWVAGWDPLERALIGKKTLTEAAMARAERAFDEYGVHRTTAGTGVLVFASLFEHVVLVLPDKGVSSKVDAQAWSKVTTAFGEGMRAQRPVEALKRAITECGTILRDAAPHHTGAENPNELSDEVRS